MNNKKEDLILKKKLKDTDREKDEKTEIDRIGRDRKRERYKERKGEGGHEFVVWIS